MAPLRRRLVRRCGGIIRPGDQVGGGGEPAHVGADFGDDDLRGQDARDGPQQPNRVTERGEFAIKPEAAIRAWDRSIGTRHYSNWQLAREGEPLQNIEDRHPVSDQKRRPAPRPP
jgi:hypothetical protein